MAQPGEEYLAVLRASYDYEPQSEDEIAVKENQIVFLLEKTDDDWWKVKIKSDSQEEDSPSGLVPAAYVEQAEHTSIAKALYDYDAAAPGELSIKEDDALMVFDREDEWILVQSQKEGGKAGFVPGNYIEEPGGEEQVNPPPELELEAEPEPGPRKEREQQPVPRPPSPKPPARPTSVYVDPADLVAQTPVKAQADHIRTWAVSEVDKKGKKKKGTLGIGNGSLFFASESDKTPVQKWDTTDVEDFTIERHKHILIDMGGSSPTKLHFNVGKEEIAETILTKLDDSRKLAISNAKAAKEAELHRRPALTPPPHPMESGSPSKKNGVRFTDESPEIIPPREPSEEDEAEVEGVGGDNDQGEFAVALYDFEGTGPDELSVQEGERLCIIEKEGEEWWKCRNSQGDEGVVPASYLESLGSPADDSGQARKEQERAESEKRERETRERAERERKKADQERAKAAAEEQKKREERDRAAEDSRKKQGEETKRGQQKSESERPPRSSAKKASRDSSSARTSSEPKNAPPPESTRTWHDRSGQFRVEAALLGYADGKLRLHKVNGVVIEVPSEKMSMEDMQYVERLMKKPSSGSSRANAPPPPRTVNDDDDQPLGLKRPAEATKRSRTSPQKKGPQIDWFEFFLSAGCDVDDCTRYSHSFEKDKIDESLLPDITESTMRSLGLREGDIIRLNKVIQQKYAKPKASPSDQQLASDEELAMRLQEEENAKKLVSQAPNLFTGAGGVLKNNNVRRGRPQPSKSQPPPAVDLGTIGTASEHIKRSDSPLIRTSSPAIASPTQLPARSNSAMATVSGFEDDAWTNRPGSKPPTAPPVSAPPSRPQSVPLAPQTAATSAAAPPQEVMANGPSPLGKTEADVFDQLARLSELKTSRVVPSVSPAPLSASAPPAISAPAISAPVISPPPSFNNGLGVGPSSMPIGPMHNQQTGAFPLVQQYGPRGPFAPVPANQGLLQPLISTQTGFNSFLSTRPASASPFQPQPLLPLPPQPSFLQPQVTGFHNNPQPIMSQPTGFATSAPMLAQPTGMGGPFGGFTPTSAFPNASMLPAQTNPTGFSPFGQSPFNNVVSTPSPAPSNHVPGANTSPANIFAQMKSGTFASGNEHTGPQQADRYDSLRVSTQPTGWVSQPGGWGIQPNTGF